MSMPQQKFLVPPEVLVPRGAQLAVLLAVPVLQLRRLGLAIWHALEAHGRLRALHELHGLAERCEDHDPERALQLRSAHRFLSGRTS